MQRAQATRRVEARPVARPGQGDVVRHLDGLARLMDDLVRIPGLGLRVGLDPIIGLIPGVGDVATSVMSFAILIGAAYAGVPKVTLFRMGLNVALDMTIGALPFFGDLFDVWWKSNQRNMALLRRATPAAGQVARRGTSSDWAFVGAVISALFALLIGVIAIVGWVVSQLGRLVIG
jgi:hypothetical protein